MDWLKGSNRVTSFFEKYKYVILVILIGMFLMLLPTQKKEETRNIDVENLVQKESIDTQLVKILSQIQGVGKVQVMITEQTGPETIYQVDEDIVEGEGSNKIKRETVVVSGGGVQAGLIQTITPPTYLGAIIVCQGAGSPAIQLAVASAVSAVTGISMDRISVLEMK